MYILNLKLSEIPHYIKVKESTMIESFDPNAATKFCTKEEAMQWGAKHTTLAEYLEAVPFLDAVEKFQMWASSEYICGERELVNSEYSRPYNNESKEAVFDWLLGYKTKSLEVRYEDYKTWPHLWSCFRYIWDLSVIRDCGENGTTITMGISPDGVFDDFEEELRFALPKITFCTKENKKIISIIDDNLCKGGNSVELHIDAIEEDCEVRHAYGQLQARGTLKEVFEYLRKHRYLTEHN